MTIAKMRLNRNRNIHLTIIKHMAAMRIQKKWKTYKRSQR